MTLQSRRDFLHYGGLGFGALALSHLLSQDTSAVEHFVNPLTVRGSHLPGTAKSVIFLFMQGGPSQLETFDPKPMLAKYDGQLLPKHLQDYDLARLPDYGSAVPLSEIW